jgi:hypothetical protein
VSRVRSVVVIAAVLLSVSLTGPLSEPFQCVNWLSTSSAVMPLPSFSFPSRTSLYSF